MSISRKSEEEPAEKSIREVEEKKDKVNSSSQMTPTTTKTVLKESNSDTKTKALLNEAATQTSFRMSDDLERLKIKNKRQSLIQSDTIQKQKLKQMIQVQRHEKVTK